jgi:hypothetical protein
MKRDRTPAEWAAMREKAQRQIEAARAAGLLPPTEDDES